MIDAVVYYVTSMLIKYWILSIRTWCHQVARTLGHDASFIDTMLAKCP